MNSLKRTFGFILQHPLARRHLFRSFYKFFSWQIRSRLKQGFLIEPFVENTKIAVKHGLSGITGNIYSGLFEFEDMAFLLHFLRQGDVFFDVGANAGSYTILAAGIKNATCISFEPVPASFEILEKNISVNKIEKLVQAENCGVGARAGITSFTTDQDAGNHVKTEFHTSNNSIDVKMVSLNDYAEKYKPALIKIDVEGYETEVIAGADKILIDSTLTAIIIELNGSGQRYGYSEMAIHETLTNYGFSRYKYDPFTRTLTEKNERDKFNTLYIRNFDFVKQRVKSSAPVKVFNENI